MFLHPDHHRHVSEICHVEKVIDVEVTLNGGEGERDWPARIRIEALHNLRNGRYSTRGYVELDVVLQLQPELDVVLRLQPEMSPREPVERTRIWAHYDLPWTDGTSADDVLQQALELIANRCVQPPE